MATIMVKKKRRLNDLIIHVTVFHRRNIGQWSFSELCAPPLWSCPAHWARVRLGGIDGRLAKQAGLRHVWARGARPWGQSLPLRMVRLQGQLLSAEQWWKTLGERSSKQNLKLSCSTFFFLFALRNRLENQSFFFFFPDTMCQYACSFGLYRNSWGKRVPEKTFERNKR